MENLRTLFRAAGRMLRAEFTTRTTRVDYIPRGFRAAGGHGGLKSLRRPDVALLVSDTPCTTAATFTTNHFLGAPVQVARELLEHHPKDLWAVVANSVIANAATGAQGLADARRLSTLAADLTGVPVPAFPMSTGLIGSRLPMDKVERGLRRAVRSLGASSESFVKSARAILLEDTHPKLRSVSFQIGGRDVRLFGMAKGAGMIHPKMATCLGVLCSDVNITQPCLQTALRHAIDQSFNRITIDGDMSCNDTAVLLANGRAHHSIIDRCDTPDYITFASNLTALCEDLARSLVRDGGGATKFITVRVRGTSNDDLAREVAREIATSEQLKTALSGDKANWGPILARAGQTKIPADFARASLWLRGGTEEMPGDSVHLYQNGQLAPDLKPQDEREILQQKEILVDLDLGDGDGHASVWTCDLTVGYVAENS